MKYSGKLELTWVNKDNDVANLMKIEPRILVEDKSKSYGDPKSENILIHGDNLVALKALERDFSGKIKCVYIDPPYNTGSAFEHYDDNVEHSIWLSLMNARLRLLRTLLSEEGVIFISIDDDERDYLKVLCDEIFGRKNFVGALIWEKKKKPSFLSNIGVITEYVLIYAKDKNNLGPLTYGTTTEGKKYPFNNAGNGERTLTFPPKTVSFVMKDQIVKAQDMSEGNIKTTLLNDLVIKNGTNENEFSLSGEWRYSQEKLNEIIAKNEKIIISKIPFRPNHVKTGGEPKKMKNLLSIAHYEMATNEDATEESRKLFGTADAFDYPKPEKLLEAIISCSTKKGDYVLDSFLGSGTTAAVAHKLERRWIGIELMNTAYTHCKKRMDLVIDGEQGGISKSANWKGGGGYKFFELAEPLLVKNPIIPVFDVNPTYTFEMVCEAICKIEAFTYAPADFYHGYSTENRFIHVTFEYVNGEYVAELSAKLNEKQSLVIYCLKHQKGIPLPDNIEIRRIPKDIQEKCKFESEEE